MRSGIFYIFHPNYLRICTAHSDLRSDSALWFFCSLTFFHRVAAKAALELDFQKRIVLERINLVFHYPNELHSISIINRQFYCNQSSTFSISYQYVYCVANLTDDFTSELTITVGNSNESYEWYHEEYNLTSLPANASDYDGSTFSIQSNSSIFQCLDTDKDDNLDNNGNYSEYNINTIDVSYEFTANVNSTDSILIQISNYLVNHNYWFMIGNVEIECKGL